MGVIFCWEPDSRLRQRQEGIVPWSLAHGTNLLACPHGYRPRAFAYKANPLRQKSFPFFP